MILASASSNQTVKPMDGAVGEPRTSLEGYTGDVYSIAWSPDGKTLATGSDDRTVKLWDAATGKLLADLPSHGGRVTADEIYRGLRTGKERKLWRIACSTFLGSLMVAGLFIFLAPLPGRANDEEDKRADNQKNRRAEIEALRVQVESRDAASKS